MRTLLVILFANVAFFAESSDVIELSDDDFKSRTQGEDLMLVEFFAPWCGHCKRLAPEYEDAATELKANDPPVPLAKVDCTEGGKETCGKHGVSGYPTLKIFRNGEVSKDYDGPREAKGIVSYMKKQAGPSSKEMMDMESMKKKMDSSDLAMIAGFFDKKEDLRTEFMNVANEYRERYTFLHTTSEEIITEMGHKDEIVIFRPKHLHTKLEPSKVVYTGIPEAFTIKKFIDATVHGLVGHMTQDNSDQFKKPLCVVYYGVDYKLNPKGTNYWRNRVIKVASEFKEKVLNFAIASKGDFSRVLDDIGSKSEDQHTVLITSDDESKYVMRETFSVDTFRGFLEQYFAGKLEPYIKSEDAPEENDGPVKVVVGKTFNEIVNDPTKDVLIEFYAPWCGHCKNLEPIYNELGEKLKDVKDIVIAKMDATANDVPPPFKVSGFPTLYFAPMNSKNEPKKYQSGRDVDSFVEYLKREATNPFELPTTDKKKKKKKSKKEKDEL